MIGSKSTIRQYAQNNTEKWGTGLIIYWQSTDDDVLKKLRQKVWDLRMARSTARESAVRAATLKMRTKKTVTCSGCGSKICTKYIHLDRSNKCPVCHEPDDLVKIVHKKGLDNQIKKAEEKVYAREKVLVEKSKAKRAKVEAANATRKKKKELPQIFSSGVVVGGWGPY